MLFNSIIYYLLQNIVLKIKLTIAMSLNTSYERNNIKCIVKKHSQYIIYFFLHQTFYSIINIIFIHSYTVEKHNNIISQPVVKKPQ